LIKSEKNSNIVKSIHLSDVFRTVSVGRLGSFHSKELFDEPYGYTYEIVDKKLKVLPPKALQDVGTISSIFWKDAFFIVK
jgi:hypothetical protein